jgi:hypothetical protein
MKKFLIILSTLLLTFGIAAFCYAIPGEDGTPALGEGGAGVQEITPEALITGKCTPTTKVHFAVADDTSLSTTSTTFVDVPSMSVTFTIPAGTGRSCVRVEFSAYVFAPSELMEIRTLLDGTTVGAPGVVQFEAESVTFATSRAFNFLFTDVRPGTHTITMQWLSFSGGNVFVHRRSMFVHHK